MQKKILITNGMARSGKDTFAKYLNYLIPTYKYSSIDRVKEIARYCGWDGSKEERDRKFLSDLKVLTTKYSDMSFRDIAKQVDWFRNVDDHYKIMIIDIREPEEIDRAKHEFGAKTVLIENNQVKYIISNIADAGVFNYKYDYIVPNNGTLSEFMNVIEKFAKEKLEIEPLPEYARGSVAL